MFSLAFRLRQRNHGGADAIKIDAIPFLLAVMYDNECSPVVIYADCCLRRRVSLRLTGILFYDFFRRERILRVNDASS